MITQENIDKIQIITTPKTLFNISKFVLKLSQKLGIEKNDILIVFGLAKEKYSESKRSQALEFSKLSEEEKLKHASYKELQEILDYYETRSIITDSSKLMIKVIDVLLSDFDEFGNAGELLTEFINLLSVTTKETFDTLINSDFRVLFELFKRSILKPSQAWGEAEKIKK